MNWLDWVLVAIVGIGAVRGFFRGFVVEVATLVAVVAGIWAAAHFNTRVAAWVGMDPGNEVFSFVIVFVAVLLLVFLLAKVVTTAMDMALLSLPNKVAGLAFGALRAAFILSVLLNILLASTWSSSFLPTQTVQNSKLIRPVRAFAPMLVPALKNGRWVQQAVDAVKKETTGLGE